jgi:hypothetical protein
MFPVLGRKIIEFQQHIANLVRGLDLDDQLLASRLDPEIRFV